MHIIYLNLILFARFYLQVLVHNVDTLSAFPIIDQGVAVNDNTHLVIGRYVEVECLRAHRSERALIASREVIEIHSRGEDGGTTVALIDWLPVHSLCSRCTGHVFVIPISGLHALLPIIRNFVVPALTQFVSGKSATGNKYHIVRLSLQALQYRDRLGGITAIVTPHHRRINGIGTHHHNLLAVLLQW